MNDYGSLISRKLEVGQWRIPGLFLVFATWKTSSGVGPVRHGSVINLCDNFHEVNNLQCFRVSNFIHLAIKLPISDEWDHLELVTNF